MTEIGLHCVDLSMGVLWWVGCAGISLLSLRDPDWGEWTDVYSSRLPPLSGFMPMNPDCGC